MFFGRRGRHGLCGMGIGVAAVIVAGFCAAASAQIGTSSAAGKRPMTFADLQQMKRVSDPQVSPSGKWVMFSVTEVDLEKNSKVNHLWVVPLGSHNAKADSSSALRNDNQKDALQNDNPKDAGAIASSRGASAPRTDGQNNDAERQVTFWKEGESDGRFSPDGKQVSFIAADSATGLSQIFLASWDEAAGTLGTPKRLTTVSSEADGAVWSPNSKRILFASRVYPECSDEASWVDEDLCDKRKDDAAAANPVKAQVFEHLLYRHWNSYVGPKRSHVLVVSANDGNAVRDLTPRRDIGDAEAPTFSLGGPVGYAWAPGSEEIAYVTNLDLVPAASTNNDVFTLLLDDAGERPRKISTSPGSDDGPAYSPDGKYIAFRSQARAGYESDRFRLMLFDRSKGTTKELMPKLDTWVDEFVWMDDSKHLIFVSGRKGEESYGMVSAYERGGNYEFRLRFDEAGEFSDIHPLQDGRAVATRMLVDRPSEVVLLPPQSYDKAGNPVGLQTPLVMTHVNDSLLALLDLPAMESFWFSGAENATVQGFIVRPPKFDPARKYPLKFLIHGGPQGAWGDAWSYRWNPELMAASGYVVVMVNPRGSTGYGQAFIDGVNGDWGGKAYVDLMKGLDYAEGHYPFIDKTRECALGASYGGFMADWILTHTDRFACIVTHDGMFNPQSAYGTTEELWFNEWEFRNPGEATPGQPWRYFDKPVAEDPFRKWSPLLSIRSAKTPTLVIHSQRDYRLDVSEGFQLFTALQRMNVPSKMLYFPDEGHWVLKPQNSKLWYEVVGDWCDRWTKTNRYATGSPSPAVNAAPVVAAPKVSASPRTGQSKPTELDETQPLPATVAPAAPSKGAKAKAVAPTPPVVATPAPASVGPKTQTAVGGAEFTITLSAPDNEVQVGSDARVTITLTNVSDHQILFGHKPGMDSPEFSYRIEVRNAAGKIVEETEYGREAMLRQQSESRTVDYVQPGGTTVQTAHIAKLVSLNRPGRYTVQVSRKVGSAVVKSNELTLNVVP
ncbi:alpha/beta hydrolase family protein [Tunturiibacter lichenicola]|uniref:alpha/beta hydrolase family protein n=1 Tax=Tunturiibacter lichenicola TaxID=2051959 RepID=UPI0021B19901|nr:S9 family peptidase [Edaphobacter lichenicola]